MNCQDISLAMDDRDIGALSEAQRHEFDAHLEICPDCAGDWDLHVRLAATQAPPLPANLQSRIERALPVRGRVAGHGGSRRLVVISVVAAFAAAAAMLSLYLMQTRTPADGSAPILVTTSATEPLPEAAPALAAEPVEATSAAPAVVPAAQAPAREAADLPRPSAALPTVRVLSLQNQATGLAFTAVESLFAEFLANLRAYNDIAVLAPNQPEPVGSASAQLQVRVRGYGPQPEGKFTIELTLERQQPDGSYRPEFAMRAPVDIAAACADTPPFDTIELCHSPRHAAGSQARTVRAQLLRAPSQRDPHTRLTDQSLNPAARLTALAELRGKLSDPAILQSAIDLAKTATDPMVREQAWLMLYRLRSPDLVVPITEAMVQDPDANVRLQAMTVAAVDFADDPRLGAAFATIAQSDAKPMLRALAHGGFEAGGYWYRYMADSLKDASRPDAERIEALAYQLSSPLPWDLQGFVKVNNLVPVLRELLPRMVPRSAADNKSLLLLSRLAQIDEPAVTDLVVRSVEELWAKPTPASIPMGILRNMLGRVRDDSRVRAALEKIGAGDPDPNVRQAVADMLKKP